MTILTALEKPTLGRPAKSYRARSFHKGDLLTWYLPGVILPTAPLAYGIWRMYFGYTKFGPVAASIWGTPWFSAAAIALIPFILLHIRFFRSRRQRVVLHENGICFYHIMKCPYPNLYWSQIVGVATKSTQYKLLGRLLNKRESVTIYPSLGEPIQLNQRLQQLPHLAQQIKKHVYPRIEPELRAHLHAGRWLYFGAIRFNRKRIAINTQTYAWKTIHEIRIQGGHLVIEFDGRGHRRISTDQIPNLEILIQLLEKELYL